jgi:hypothetical protein
VLSTGSMAVQTGQWFRLPAPAPVPFWLQRFSLLRWVKVTMAHHTFAGAAHRCLLNGIPGLRLPGSAIYPRSRSLRTSRRPGGYAVTPAPGGRDFHPHENCVTRLTPCGLPESRSSLSANGSHETHFNIQRRLYDYQFSLARTPAELEQRHQAFIQTYNTTAHQGLLKDRRLPPIPVEVLGTAKGRLYTPEALARHFSQAVFPRITNRYGCVTLHSYHFYVEAGLPQTQVLLWVSGEQLRAVFENVLLAEYHCHYDWPHHQVKEIRSGAFYPTRFASLQGTLIPLTPQDSVVVYRVRRPRRRTFRPSPMPQVLLFEVAPAG